MPDIAVTTGDTQPLLTLTLYTDETKTTVLDLTTAASVTWHFDRGNTSVAKPATITDPAAGETTLQWDGDPDITPGYSWRVRAVIVWNDATVETSVNVAKVDVLKAA